ncbi:hypothetical protein RFI_29929, partial [Reticulomyxa filosa]
YDLLSNQNIQAETWYDKRGKTVWSSGSTTQLAINESTAIDQIIQNIYKASHKAETRYNRNSSRGHMIITIAIMHTDNKSQYGSMATNTIAFIEVADTNNSNGQQDETIRTARDFSSHQVRKMEEDAIQQTTSHLNDLLNDMRNSPKSSMKKNIVAKMLQTYINSNSYCQIDISAAYNTIKNIHTDANAHDRHQIAHEQLHQGSNYKTATITNPIDTPGVSQTNKHNQPLLTNTQSINITKNVYTKPYRLEKKIIITNTSSRK